MLIPATPCDRSLRILELHCRLRYATTACERDCTRAELNYWLRRTHTARIKQA
ncbi:MAG: hypothetical protein IGR92_01135 [Leptolyngbyaceae cyanobacterium T60_A2020_046]|nr:hypothetical protein [Leptolyngbyaceae cyanobacterium T60_A2020_046]